MKLSIIIPAYNEEKLLSGCLQSVQAALAGCGRPDLSWEIVVCDNASTDATPRLAREAGATVVRESIRRISCARNAGAAAALGEWFLFIDADSRLSTASLSAVLAAAQSGRCVGGGSLIDLDEKPWWGALLVGLWTLFSLALKWAAGSFVFCRADAFRAVGGFPPELAAGEELGLSRKLRLWAKPRGLDFLILTQPRHVSSGRKFALYSPWEFLKILLDIAKSPQKSLRDTAVHKNLYDGRR